MVAGADGNTLGVEEGAHIEVVNPLDIESEDARAMFRIAVKGQTGNFEQLLAPIFEDLIFMRPNLRKLKPIQVIDGCCHANGADDVRGSGFELEGSLL